MEFRSVLHEKSGTAVPGINPPYEQLNAVLAKSENLIRSQSKSDRASKLIEISPSKIKISAQFRELWDYRELIVSFVSRDLTTRYRQTILGVGWAVIQPVGMMIVFTLFLGRLVHASTDSCPYPIFVYTSLLVWQYISTAVTRCSNSVLSAGGLMKKVYFPRLAVPIASVVPSMIDFAIGFTALVVLMAVYGIAPSTHICFLPIFLVLIVLTTLGLGLWTSALHVKYRDIHHIVPFALQLWLFSSPVIYSSKLVPPYLKPLFHLNPLVGIIDGIHWSLLGTAADVLIPTLFSAAVSMLILVTGFLYFRSAEDQFADYV